MIKLIFIFTFGWLSICNDTPYKVQVIDKATAIKVKPGYYLKDDDSTFVYKGSKYFIEVKEVFDERGNIIRAYVAGDVGYSIYTQHEFCKYKNLLNEYSLTKVIDVKLIDNHSILFNGHKIMTKEIDKAKKEIYYNLKSRDTLYRITYR